MRFASGRNDQAQLHTPLLQWPALQQVVPPQQGLPKPQHSEPLPHKRKVGQQNDPAAPPAGKQVESGSQQVEPALQTLSVGQQPPNPKQLSSEPQQVPLQQLPESQQVPPQQLPEQQSVPTLHVSPAPVQLGTQSPF